MTDKPRKLTVYRDGKPVGTRRTRHDYKAAVYAGVANPTVWSWHRTPHAAQRAARHAARYGGTAEVLTDIREG